MEELNEKYFCEWCPLKDWVKKIEEKLFTYEKSGLAPEDIPTALDLADIACALKMLKEYQALGTVDYLRELVKSNKQKSLIEPPCKVGDTVYVIEYNCIKRLKVFSQLYSKQSYLVVGKKYNDLYYWHYLAYDDFGKVAFLTREEAEKALERRRTDDKG